MDQHRPQPSPPIVLCFSASDPSAGAGMQADLMTLSSMGCHPLSVITALTVQDTIGVDSILAIDADWVEDQARALLEDMPVAAFKIGLLGSVENVAVIAEIIADYPDIPLVLDPVLASGRGDTFADEEMIAALRELLLPQTTVLTPNSLEARRLCEESNEDNEDHEDSDSEEVLPLIECARRLLGFGAQYVLITGTHENTAQVVNQLYAEEGLIRSDAWDRLPGSYHGSGCTLASAIAASLAHGLSVPDAVRDAQDYTWQALAAGFRPGMGQYIPDRFFWARAGSQADSEGGEAADDASGEHA
jgi:hydroxymethylpyrimidine/phosphomethylpyrimidine kinase